MIENVHPFFTEINTFPELIDSCNLDITKLPEAYKGKRKIKAILLGADPTNNGVKNNQGLKELDAVFGIGSKYEKDFFSPQLTNLKHLGLTKDELYIQNLCRNYFGEETSKNKHWNGIAQLWIKYLRKELVRFNKTIPVLVTAEKILRAIIPTKISASELYEHPEEYLPFFSESLGRNVYPLFRNPKYYLSVQDAYKQFLLTKF